MPRHRARDSARRRLGMLTFGAAAANPADAPAPPKPPASKPGARALDMDFVVRALVLGLPIAVACVVDWLLFWRYMFTAQLICMLKRGFKEPWKESIADLKKSEYGAYNGALWFDILDMITQLLFVPFLAIAVVLALITDVFTCNYIKATARLVPLLGKPTEFVRSGIAFLAQREVIWSTDEACRTCCKIFITDLAFSVSQVLKF